MNNKYKIFYFIFWLLLEFGVKILLILVFFKLIWFIFILFNFFLFLWHRHPIYIFSFYSIVKFFLNIIFNFYLHIIIKNINILYYKYYKKDVIYNSFLSHLLIWIFKIQKIFCLILFIFFLINLEYFLNFWKSKIK